MDTQKWDYRVLLRRRQVNKDWSGDLERECRSLGDQGWELLAVTTAASLPGETVGWVQEERWVFKRPKR
jgi:hypothetical protein